MNEQVEFDCVDCSVHVYAFGHWDKNPRCLECKWIESIKDPVEKMKMRAFLCKDIKQSEEKNDKL